MAVTSADGQTLLLFERSLEVQAVREKGNGGHVATRGQRWVRVAQWHYLGLGGQGSVRPPRRLAAGLRAVRL